MNAKIGLQVEDNLQVQTIAGLRAVKEIELEVALSWKKEVIPITDAKRVQYSAPEGVTGPTFGRVEFETKEATKTNVKIGIQQELGRDELILSMQLVRKDDPKG